MSIPTAGLNLSALQNLEPINLSIETSAEGIMNAVNTAGITYLNGWFGIMVLSTMLFILFWTLTDDSPNAKFRYSYIRGLNLSLTICSMFSAVLLIIGFDNNFYTFSLFALLTLISTILLLIIENKE